MRIFIESIDCVVWDAIVNEPYVPKMLVDNVYVDKPWCDWSDVNEAILTCCFCDLTCFFVHPLH